MRRPRNRPPHLEPTRGPERVVAPPTIEQRLARERVSGRASTPAPSELRRLVERANGDHLDLDALALAWSEVTRTFGATPSDPVIDPGLTVGAMHTACDRIVDVAGTGARVALATSRPASLLALHLALARLARSAGADIVEAEDSSPMRIDGRTGRWLRWFDGIATVTDGEALFPAHGPEAAREWLFLLSRPALVVADGPFADAALDAGIEVVALAALDHVSLVLGGRRPLVVPMRTDRPPSAYRPLVDACLRLERRAIRPEV